MTQCNTLNYKKLQLNKLKSRRRSCTEVTVTLSSNQIGILMIGIIFHISYY